MKVCFFARVRDKQLLELVDFYRNDIRILEELGFEVVLANRFSEIPLSCDLYFTWWWTTGILSLVKSKLARKPNIVVSALHYNDGTKYGYVSRPLWQRLVMRLSMRLADWNLAISKVDFDGLHKLGIHNSSMAYLCVDTDTYSPGKLGAQDRSLVVSIAHLNRLSIIRKKLMLVIRAIPFVVKELPQVRFVIAGSKEDGFEELVLLAKELNVGDFVCFPGRITTAEKIDLYHKARVFVQPSVFEAFGMAQAEAMSCGVPVITNNVGSLTEVVGDCGTYLVNDDPRELANDICRFFKDETLWNGLGTRSRERVQANFSYQFRKEKIRETIEMVMRRRNGL
jgi:glycosyltransferase involved in cell wall biosynthesis